MGKGRAVCLEPFAAAVETRPRHGSGLRARSVRVKAAISEMRPRR